MTDTDETAPAPDHDEATARPTVPNVRPHAVSGLGHELLNPDAAAATEAPTPESDPDPYASSVGVEVPAGDLASRLVWVSDSEDHDERGQRADAIWAYENTTDPEGDHSELAAALKHAVDQTEEQPTNPDGSPIPAPSDPVADTVPDAAGTDDEATGAPEAGDNKDSAPIEEDGAATAGDGEGAGEQTGDPETPA